MRRAQVKNRPAGNLLGRRQPQVTRSRQVGVGEVWPERLLAGSALQFARSAGQPSTPGCADGNHPRRGLRAARGGRLW